MARAGMTALAITFLAALAAPLTLGRPQDALAWANWLILACKVSCIGLGLLAFFVTRDEQEA